MVSGHHHQMHSGFHDLADGFGCLGTERIEQDCQPDEDEVLFGVREVLGFVFQGPVSQGQYPPACCGKTLSTSAKTDARSGIGQRRQGSVFPQYLVGPGQDLLGPSLGQ